MLKITVLNSGAEQKVIVEGKLAEPCVSELETAWNRAREVGRNGQIVVDLSEVTSVDPRGKAALVTMVSEGARLVANGVYTKYLIERLIREARERGDGPRRRSSIAQRGKLQ